MSRYKWVATSRPQIIGVTAGKSATARARREGEKLDEHLALRKSNWVILPPENMNIALLCNLGVFPGNITLSLPQEIGRELLRRRRTCCHILERDDVHIDAVLEGGSYEDVLLAFGLVADAEVLEAA